MIHYKMKYQNPKLKYLPGYKCTEDMNNETSYNGWENKCNGSQKKYMKGGSCELILWKNIKYIKHLKKRKAETHYESSHIYVHMCRIEILKRNVKRIPIS